MHNKAMGAVILCNSITDEHLEKNKDITNFQTEIENLYFQWVLLLTSMLYILFYLLVAYFTSQLIF